MSVDETARLQQMVLHGGAGVIRDEGRIGDWMQTYSGARFYPDDPRVGDFDILDIAVAMGNMTRYGGHTPFYCVGEHAYLCSYLVPPDYALEALFHDASEAFLSDLIRPVKRVLKANQPDNYWFTLDTKISRCIAEQFGFPVKHSLEVAKADVSIIGLEKEVLMPRADEWQLEFPVPRHIKISCWEPRAATNTWLKRYFQLTGFRTEEALAVQERLWNYRDQDQRAFLAQWKERP